MKKLISALLLATALALASCSWTAKPLAAQVTHRPAEQDQVVDSPLQDIGGGFKLTFHKEEKRIVAIITFPEDAYLTANPESDVKFRAAIHIALVKLFGCEPFFDCTPQLYGGPDKEVLMKANGIVYELRPLFKGSVPDSASPIVGIAILPPEKDLTPGV